MRILPILALLVLAGCAQTVRNRIYLPDPVPSTLAAFPGRTPERVEVASDDGLILHGDWWPPAAGDDRVIVYLPGNAGNLELNARFAAPLAELGPGLMVASWRGYGDNPGRPSEVGLQADGAAFIAEVRRRAPGARVVLFGYSTGAAVAIEQAARIDPALLVTLGAFTRLADVAPRGTGFLLPDRYDNLAAIARVGAPIFLIHGTEDEIVPYASAARLRAASGDRARVVTLRGGDHHPDMTIVARQVRRMLDLEVPANHGGA